MMKLIFCVIAFTTAAIIAGYLKAVNDAARLNNVQKSMLTALMLILLLTAVVLFALHYNDYLWRGVQ